MSGCGLLKTKQPGSAAEGGYHVERTESEQGLLSIVLLVLLQRNCNPKTSQNLKMTLWVPGPHPDRRGGPNRLPLLLRILCPPQGSQKQQNVIDTNLCEAVFSRVLLTLETTLII
nr:uncharacterized protein LOC110354585 isoform X5 [Anas platyrhynchos]